MFGNMYLHQTLISNQYSHLGPKTVLKKNPSEVTPRSQKIPKSMINLVFLATISLFLYSKYKAAEFQLGVILKPTK